MSLEIAGGVLATLYFVLVLLALYSTYYAVGKLAPKKTVATKEDIYACGERSFLPSRKLALTFFKYIIIFTVFDAVPVLIMLAVVFIKPLQSLEYIMLAVYLALSTVAALIIVRR
ncbi:MAG: hypothetical protein DRJ51_00180 [Thermoprotei archaeon]|nr:MAG: hypothetical protein DRJ51_00180 [Thermoprotei archaeon]RLF03066.1 MAG: hypothetical protein DRJ59_01735 [Thermoprotei archaeon]